MKQGKIYNKLILGLLLATVISYMGFAVFRALREPMNTVRAIEYESGAACRTTGYVVRDETVLTSPYGITVPVRSEGERVGVGQAVATGYQTEGAQARQREIEETDAMLAQLKYASDSGTDPDQDLVELFSDSARYISRRDFSSLSTISPRLKGLLLHSALSKDELDALGAKIEGLESELSQLKTVSGGTSRDVLAPESGWFSGAADGLEALLTPGRLNTITVSELKSLAPEPLPVGACGRLVRRPDWYFVCAVPAELLAESELGDTVQAGLSHGLNTSVPMTIARIGDEENGERPLVLSCENFIQDVTLLRRQTVELVFRAYAGLRVPKTALQMDEQGRPCVYVIESGRCKMKAVSLLYDNGESYVVLLDKSDTNNLWPGDEIVLNPRNLYDGKVVDES